MKDKSTSSSTDKKTIPVWSGVNYSFPKFDRGVMNWARVKWNEKLGHSMWENPFADELFDIPETAEEWIHHCEIVHSYNRMADFKTSRLLYYGRTSIKRNGLIANSSYCIAMWNASSPAEPKRWWSHAVQTMQV